jgi:hypothetical protein
MSGPNMRIIFIVRISPICSEHRDRIGVCTGSGLRLQACERFGYAQRSGAWTRGIPTRNRSRRCCILSSISAQGTRRDSGGGIVCRGDALISYPAGCETKFFQNRSRL